MSKAQQKSKEVKVLNYTVEEAGIALGVGRTKAYEMIASGEIPSMKLGGKRVVPIKWLEEYNDRKMLETGRMKAVA